jgi:hypothetical protein
LIGGNQMNVMTPAAGHNMPPDPIDEICAAFEASRMEAENWLDGALVENEEQMKVVDALRKDMRRMRLDLQAGQKSATAPLYDAYKAEGERWKPTIEDVQRIENGLVAAVDMFKRELAKQKAEEERKARAEADRRRREAEEAARKANAADIEAQRAAAQAQREAEEAQKAAVKASKEQVKGLREVTLYEIEDYRAAINDILQNDKDALAAFIEEYVRKNHKAREINGVRVWKEDRAY